MGDSALVFGCALGYLGDPATFIDWNVAGDFGPVVRDVVDRVRSGAGRVSDVIIDVPAFLDRVSDSDLTFFNPGQVVELLAAHGCTDQIGAFLRRLSGGLHSTGTVRTDGAAVLAAARRFLAGEPRTNHAGLDLADALAARAACTCWQDRCPASGCPVSMNLVQGRLADRQGLCQAGRACWWRRPSSS